MSIIMNPIEDEWHGFEIEAPEVWSAEFPKRGDHIRVCRMNGLYYHHGIYVSDDEVIHFTGDDDDSVLDWSKAHVISTSLEQFLDGGIVEVKIYNDEERADLYHVEGIVAYARDCLGDGGYNLLFNNCEHFANACTLGKYRSRQVESLGGGNNMGLFGGIGEVFGKIGKFFFGDSDDTGERTTNNFNYEPDKVKIAQIESELKLKMADKEKERIELMRDAQIDLIKAQALSQTMIEEARRKGMLEFAKQFVEIQEKMIDVAKMRIEIINQCTMPVILDIENFYFQIKERIDNYDDEFMLKRLPRLLEMQKKYEQGTPEYITYGKQIDSYRLRHSKFLEDQMIHISERQKMVLTSFIETKRIILDQTGKITEKIADGYLHGIDRNNLLTENDGVKEKILPGSVPEEVKGERMLPESDSSQKQ